jgi:hypothetical protein
MWWLWYVAPVAAGLIYLLTGQVDRRALKEIEAWREALAARRAGAAAGAKDPKNKQQTASRETAELPKKKKSKKAKDLGPKRIAAPPGEFVALAELVGGGRALGNYEIVARAAYATFVMGDLAGSSDHQTVLVRLSDKAPTFTARPNAFFAGKPLPPTAIEFRKDPDFAAAYLVEANAAHAKSIGRWLTRSLRELLIDSSEVWLYVSGKTLALTIYGPVRQEKIAALLEIADVFVAEYGDEGGPSLFGEDEDERAARHAEADAANAEDEDEDEASETKSDADADDADEDEEDDAADEEETADEKRPLRAEGHGSINAPGSSKAKAGRS